MKVLALGGSGGMGRYAVETALTFDGIEQIIVADINEEAANSYANSLPDKVVGIGLDVTDRSKLTEIMLNVDVVLNTVGPFFKYGPPVLEAAIDRIPLKQRSPAPLHNPLAQLSSLDVLVLVGEV